MSYTPFKKMRADLLTAGDTTDPAHAAHAVPGKGSSGHKPTRHTRRQKMIAGFVKRHG
jgi:hypothetical protein